MNGKGKTGRWGRIRSRKNKQSQQPEKQTNIRTFYTAASNRFWTDFTSWTEAQNTFEKYSAACDAASSQKGHKKEDLNM